MLLAEDFLVNVSAINANESAVSDIQGSSFLDYTVDTVHVVWVFRAKVFEESSRVTVGRVSTSVVMSF